MTPMRTPVRDELGLNDPDMLLPAEASRRESRAREAMEKNNLKAGLAGLPAPKNEYQIMVPEVRGGHACAVQYSPATQSIVSCAEWLCSLLMCMPCDGLTLRSAPMSSNLTLIPADSGVCVWSVAGGQRRRRSIVGGGCSRHRCAAQGRSQSG